MENRITGLSPQRIVDEKADLADNFPAQELCEQVDLFTAEARESLLQKALAVSNEKCNGLISRLNALIEELTRQVKSVKLSVYDVEVRMKEYNEIVLGRMKFQAENMLNELKEKVRELKELSTQIQAEVSIATARATDEAEKVLTERINEMADDVIQKVNASTAVITEKVKTAEQELSRVKEDIHYERGFRKFMFWATPVMLFVQTVLTVFLLLK